MKRLREHWNWPVAVAPLAFGIVLTLVVISCGRADNPTSPSAVRGPDRLLPIEPGPDADSHTDSYTDAGTLHRNQHPRRPPHPHRRL